VIKFYLNINTFEIHQLAYKLDCKSPYHNTNANVIHRKQVAHTLIISLSSIQTCTLLLIQNNCSNNKKNMSYKKNTTQLDCINNCTNCNFKHKL
jgi:hypothetical protein